MSKENKLESKIINIDFDGTVVAHEYPDIGKDIGAIPVLKELVAAGHKLILFTMRSGEEEAQAAAWLRAQGVELYAVGKNPTQYRWTKSRKCYAHFMIDDSAIGCPLIYPPDRKRPYVNWAAVRVLLVERGLLVDQRPPIKWTETEIKCAYCGDRGAVTYRVLDNDHDDEEFKCGLCEATWRVDGCDA